MAENTDNPFKIGDRIFATAGNLNGQLGTVKWVGNIAGQKGIWYGIEFDNPVGKHDGRYDGVRYFESKSKHGAFLIATNMQIVEDFGISQDNMTTNTTNTPSVSESTNPPSEKIEDTKPVEKETPADEDVQKKIPEEAKQETKVEKPIDKPQEKSIQPEKVGTKAPEKKPGKEPPKKEEIPKKEDPAVKKKIETKPLSKATTIADKTDKSDKSDKSDKNSKADDSEKDDKINDLIAAVKKLQEEIEEKNGLIQEKTVKLQQSDSNIQILNSKNKELIEKFSEKEKKYEQEIKTLENEDSEYKKKYREVYTQLQELNKEKKELDIQHRMSQRECERLKKELEATEGSEAIIEEAILARDEALEKMESLQKELKIAQDKIVELEEERELQQLEAEEALLNQAENSDIGKLQVENMKLKQAIEKLYEQSEKDKKKMQEELTKNASKLENIPQIEEKDKEIKSLKEELNKKEYIIEELKLRIDDAEESVILAEKLSSQILDKEDEIVELRRKITKLRTELETADQLAIEGEQYMKQLENDVFDREDNIKKLEKKIKEFEEAVLEYDKSINKYKEKIGILNEENKILKDQNAEGKEVTLINKIDEMSKKQIELLNQIRDRYRREISATIDKISAKNEVLKSNILISVLPKNLKDKMNVDGISKYCNLILLKEKIFVLSNEIRRKYSTSIGASDNHEFYLWMKNLLLDLADLTYLLDLVEAKFFTFGGQDNIVEAYVNFCKSSFFNQILAVNSIVDQLFNQLKEDNLSVKFQLDTLKLVLSKLNESCINFENDVNLDLIKTKKFANQASAEGLELIFLLNNKNIKLDKFEEIYGSLTEMNSKLHLEQGEYGTLSQKGESDQKMGALLKLQAVFSSVSQSILKSSPESKLSESVTEMDKNFSKIGVVKVDNDTKGLPNRGPWSFINSILRNEIEQVSELTINLEKINAQLKDYQKENMGLQTEIKDLKTIKSTLEKRTSELQAKAEKVPQLEAEKKKLLEREKKFDDASKTIKEKLDEAESKIKSLEEENTKLRSAPQSIENVPKDPKIRQTLNKASISRMTAPVMLSENLSQAVALNTDVEDYLEMISKLILENSSLKSEWLKSKMNSLHSSMPQFSKCMEKYNLVATRENAFIGLTDDEQAKMSNTIQKIREIERTTKIRLCEENIISLNNYKKDAEFEKIKVISNYTENSSSVIEKTRFELTNTSRQFFNLAQKINTTKNFMAYSSPILENVLSGSEKLTIGSFTKIKDSKSFEKTQEIKIGYSQLKKLNEIIF